MAGIPRRAFIALAAALPLAACATVPSVPEAATAPLTLVEAFRGRTMGRGLFTAPIINSRRGFTARLDGRLAGDVLTVAEEFGYDDGQADRLTWVFRRTGAGTWAGRREDTVGEARVVEDGRTIRLSYMADFRSPSGVTRLGFEDVIYRGAPGVVVNEGIVTRLGFPIGKVRFEIRRT